MTLSKTQGYTLRTPDKVKGRYAYLYKQANNNFFFFPFHYLVKYIT